jgi:hypothetical protein
LDLRSVHVIENPDLANAKSVLWLSEPAQPFDTITANLHRFMPQMRLYRSPNFSSIPRPQGLKIIDSFGREDDLKRHSG